MRRFAVFHVSSRFLNMRIATTTTKEFSTKANFHGFGLHTPVKTGFGRGANLYSPIIVAPFSTETESIVHCFYSLRKRDWCDRTASLELTIEESETNVWSAKQAIQEESPRFAAPSSRAPLSAQIKKGLWLEISALPPCFHSKLWGHRTPFVWGLSKSLTCFSTIWSWRLRI